MPATPTRIGFITQPYRIATAGPDLSVRALYGRLARKNTEPLPSFFDSVDDAEVIAEERLALLSAGRALVTVQIDQVDAALDLDPSQCLPTVRVIDDEQDRNSRAVVVGFGIDMNTERSTLTTWG